MDRIVYYKHDKVVLSEDGEINFLIPKFNLHVSAEVKQVKGKGVHDAKRLRGKPINHYHKDLLEMFLHSSEPVLKEWKSEDILNKMRIIKHLEDNAFKFIENNWRRPISEFLYLKLLVHPKGNDQLYQLNVEKATETLRSGKFE